MRPVTSFHIEPAVPASLSGLTRLAQNVHWTWNDATQALFERLDPEVWAATGDPLIVLDRLSSARWAELAADEGLRHEVAAAETRLSDAVNGPAWFQHREGSALHQVAYFSPEFGLTETLAQYSGGLGVLAGDHLKAASDLGIPLVAIGLLYREGYFRQRLTADGWQTERYPVQDPNGLAMTPTGKTITLDLAGETISIAIWRVDVGRIPLYLLDTNVAGNSPDACAITDRLYGGDSEHRIRQEIVLGMGGVRALRALEVHPQVFHMNEGHAGFLAFERIREHTDAGLSWAEAIEAVRAGGLFTTHTPVPAGIDRFAPELMEKYFAALAAQCKVTMADLMALGHRDDEPDEKRFNMAVMGLRMAARANGVAALHGEVSRNMFNGLWPQAPVGEVPIGSVTNGVHAPTWVSARIGHLFAEKIGDGWDGADAESWKRAYDIDHGRIWQARAEGRRALVEYVRKALGHADLLDPYALTIGFARRFATYKRATLLVSEPERLKAMLLSADRPVQFVFAGKAHPADEPGKQMIQGIERFRREAGVEARFVFVPDYDMSIARLMYAGADVWLNNPRRPLEACGTSGMKAALNGALNCSILDGWWDEAFDGSNGWAIDSYEDEQDLGRRDSHEASSLFGILEREIVPLFYGRGADGVPHGWLDRVRHNWVSIAPAFTANRMVRDYTTKYYELGAAGHDRVTTDDAQPARALAAWKQRVAAAWGSVKVMSVEADAGRVAAIVELGGLSADDVLVQLVHGPLDADGEIVAPAFAPLRAVDGVAAPARYEAAYEPTSAGRYGCTVRVMPNHPLLSSPMETGRITWA